MMSVFRVAVLTCGRLGIDAANRIAELPSVTHVLVVRGPYRQPKRDLIGKIRRVYQTQGLWGFGAVITGKLKRSRATGTSDPPALHSKVEVHTVEDLHAESTLMLMHGFAPDLGVVVGTYILKPQLFCIPRLGSINLHTGKAPEYRGASPAFWEMYNGESEVGITIHQVEATLDSGLIYRQECFGLDLAPKGDPLAYIERFKRNVLIMNGLRLVVETVADFTNGIVAGTPQDATSARTYRTPNYREIRELRRRVAHRRANSRKQKGRVNRRIKSLLGWLLFRTGFYQLLLRGGVVVLFHRVDDRCSDPISITADNFDRFCEFFRKYFRVVEFGEIVTRLENRQDVSGMLAITFDDGYRDNVTTAAPILKRYQLPACFFIATDFIGTCEIPWWDKEWGVKSHWMAWDDIRALRSAGFEIGAHTCGHVDLGVVNGKIAEREIAGSVKRLETELQENIPFFSYPYGGTQQLTDNNRELVRRLGLRCCPSAYGGNVWQGDSPFQMQRQPISPWHFTPWQFGWEVVFNSARPLPNA